MNPEQAKQLVRDTFTHAYQKDQFRLFIREMVNCYDESKARFWSKQMVPHAFKEHVNHYERLGTYTAPDSEKLDILIVHLTKKSKLERARTALRDFVVYYLKQRGKKDAGLVAFVSPTEETWRFSFVRMEYETELTDAGIARAKLNFPSARRFSYLVGDGESCHTAQSRFLALLQETGANPTLEQIAESFSVETVTKEFFNRYHKLFQGLKEAIEKIAAKDKIVRDEFRAKGVETDDFARKLLGQIVFLYFIQKKGWLGVERGREWATGPRDFLRRLASGEYREFKNLFNDVLEPLFYDTLATDRGPGAWCAIFKVRIPFLNGGLFEPISGYGWKATDLNLPNALFFNEELTAEGDKGTGVLDVFDRYNFTVNEAEPLEQEVAIDPEMLGKVFENLIEDNLRKGTGAFYTPREIVHYMCQESLISYLYRAINAGSTPIVQPEPVQGGLFGPGKPVQAVLESLGVEENVSRDDLAVLIHLGEQAAHYEAALKAGTTSYEKKDRPRLPKPIKEHAAEIDSALRVITVCDPAIGSGAFPVGMMTEIVRARLALESHVDEEADRTAYHFKRHAIQSCLYGVDIDSGAVEIAKLRLWLSLVVDEEDPKEIRPLPNLDFKIVAGNSLLGFPFQSHGLAEIEKLKEQYFDEPDHDRKMLLKERIDRRISQQLAQSERSLGYRVDFDYPLFFSEVFREKGGFDVVIGNPPYGIVFDTGFKKRLSEQYRSFRQNSDTYTAFFESGLTLLRHGGQFAFITPNTYLNGDYFKELRSFLSSKNFISEITDFKNVHVFDDPTVFVAVLLATRAEPYFPYAVRQRLAQGLDEFTSATFTVREGSDRALKPDDPILDRLRNSSDLVSLHEIFLVKDVGFNYWTTGRGKKRGDNSIGQRVFYSGVRRDRRDIPFLKGRKVNRWSIGEPTNFLKHDYQQQLDHEKDTFRFSQELLEIRPKVVYRQTSASIIAAIDETGRYLDKTVHLIVPRDGWSRCSITPKALVGLLNSKLFDYLYGYISQETGGRAFAQVKTTYIKKLPIPREESASLGRMADIVGELIQAPSESAAAMLEKKLNRVVYNMYGLNPEQVQIIEARCA